MKSKITWLAWLLLAAMPGAAQFPAHPKAKVSFDDFKTLVSQVEAHRAARLIDLDTFLQKSREPGVIILDTRSDFRFDRIHVKGARHLSFTDFTQENLARVIPSLESTILIYCNNNFDGNQKDFATKASTRPLRPSSPLTAQLASQEKPIMLALNIPTYINLYGYGYRNIYELNELVSVTDPRITFEGSIASAPLTFLTPRSPAAAEPPRRRP